MQRIDDEFPARRRTTNPGGDNLFIVLGVVAFLDNFGGPYIRLPFGVASCFRSTSTPAPISKVPAGRHPPRHRPPVERREVALAHGAVSSGVEPWRLSLKGFRQIAVAMGAGDFRYQQRP